MIHFINVYKNNYISRLMKAEEVVKTRMERKDEYVDVEGDLGDVLKILNITNES